MPWVPQQPWRRNRPFVVTQASVLLNVNNRICNRSSPAPLLKFTSAGAPLQLWDITCIVMLLAFEPETLPSDSMTGNPSTYLAREYALEVAFDDLSIRTPTPSTGRSRSNRPLRGRQDMNARNACHQDSQTSSIGQNCRSFLSLWVSASQKQDRRHGR